MLLLGLWKGHFLDVFSESVSGMDLTLINWELLTYQSELTVLKDSEHKRDWTSSASCKQSQERLVHARS